MNQDPEPQSKSQTREEEELHADPPTPVEVAGQANSERELTDHVERIRQLLQVKGGGALAVRYEPLHAPKLGWSVMATFGEEAEDSPMAGGAAHGIGATLIEALDQALGEAGV